VLTKAAKVEANSPLLMPGSPNTRLKSPQARNEDLAARRVLIDGGQFSNENVITSPDLIVPLKAPHANYLNIA
jgi:hypothetical protein